MTYHKDGLKIKILNTTYDMINEKGNHNISIRMVARSLNVSATAIYRHYENYADLMAQVIQKGEMVFSEYLMEQYDPKAPSLMQLSTMAENYIRYSLDFPFLYDLMFLSEYTPITSQEDMLCDLGSQGMNQLVELINHIIIDEQLHVDVETLLTQLWAYIQGYSYLVRFHHFEIRKELLKTSIIGTLEVYK